MNIQAPALALALAAAASSRLRLEDSEPEFGRDFAAAVALLDHADRDYRRAIEQTLPPDAAAALLASMAGFRERVNDVRERARAAIGALFSRNGLTYGAFDPLDPHMPATTALSHVDGTRVATLADAARSEVEALRAAVNDAVAKRLAPAQIEALIGAKRRRRAAFESALQGALATALAPHPSMTAAKTDRTLYGLTQLAEGWY
jgi:pyruvate/2-oxoglutarate dehydrogenase complex dihydrolipoamide acyltransferase (E2) component